jgi:hypothetical protein
MKVYSEERKEFIVVPGTIRVEVGASSADIRLSSTLSLENASTQRSMTAVPVSTEK